MLSSFSLISLVGVMLGVLVLVVVMAVFSGLGRSVKDRLLGFTPHVLLSQSNTGAPDGRMTGWEDVAAKAMKLPHVEAATAYVSGFIFIQGWPNPLSFRGIDTSDTTQVAGIEKMLDLENYSTSSADLGLDDKVVISSLLAGQLGVNVGDKIVLLSVSNLDEVRKAFETSANPPLREAFAEVWKKSSTILRTAWIPDGEKFTLPVEAYREAYTPLFDLLVQDIRKPELELLEKILLAMDTGEPDEAGKFFRFDAGSKTAIEKTIAELDATDVEKMDGAIMKNFNRVVLPKEVEIIGVYQASQMTVTPDLFAPLSLAQNLAGLEQAVQGVALRLDDPQRADEFADEARKTLGDDYSLLTWGDQYRPFFALIEQQRGMMYFVLSFIMLISAFSMMAVMFTVTIQKRREIGVMKALGAAPNQIVRVFLYQGMILGTLGALLGVGLGRVVIHFRGHLQAALRTIGFDPFSSSFIGFDVLPAHNDPLEQFLFAVMAFILCSVAALVPAFFAARSDAAKSLRNL